MTVTRLMADSGLASQSTVGDKPEARSLALGIVYFAWILFLFEPEWFLAGTLGLEPLKRLAFLMFPILLLIAVCTPGRRRIRNGPTTDGYSLIPHRVPSVYLVANPESKPLGRIVGVADFC